MSGVVSLDQSRLEELKLHKRHPEGGDIESNYILGILDLIEYTKDSNTKVLEIGSYHGISTEAFLLSNLEVVSIDPLDNGTYSTEFLDKCTKYPKFSYIKGYSPKDLSTLEDNTFDMSYIDAEHRAEAVAKDIAVSIRLVKPNGWITGHDWSQVHNEVLKVSDKVKQFPDDSWAIRNNK